MMLARPLPTSSGPRPHPAPAAPSRRRPNTLSPPQLPHRRPPAAAPAGWSAGQLDDANNPIPPPPQYFDAQDLEEERELYGDELRHPTEAATRTPMPSTEERDDERFGGGGGGGGGGPLGGPPGQHPARGQTQPEQQEHPATSHPQQDPSDVLERALEAAEAYGGDESPLHAEVAHACLVCHSQSLPVGACLPRYAERLDMEAYTSVLVCLSRVGPPEVAAGVVAWMEGEGRVPPTTRCLTTLALRRLALDPEPPFAALLEPFEWMRRNSVNPSGAAVDALAQVTKKAPQDYSALYALEDVCHWMRRTDAGKTLWGAYFNLENMLAVEDRGMTEEELQRFREVDELERWRGAAKVDKAAGKAQVNDAIDAIVRGVKPAYKPPPRVSFVPPEGITS